MAESTTTTQAKPAPRKEPELDETERFFLQLDHQLAVNYYEDGDTTVPPRPAYIIRKGTRSASLLVFDPVSSMCLYKKAEGVRWARDPQTRTYEREQLGVFDLTPLGYRLLDLLK
jgi:hypothetical protein